MKFQHTSTIGKAPATTLTSSLKSLGGTSSKKIAEMPTPDDSGLWKLVTVLPVDKNNKMLQYFWEKVVHNAK